MPMGGGGLHPGTQVGLRPILDCKQGQIPESSLAASNPRSSVYLFLQPTHSDLAQAPC